MNVQCIIWIADKGLDFFSRVPENFCIFAPYVTAAVLENKDVSSASPASPSFYYHYDPFECYPAIRAKNVLKNCTRSIDHLYKIPSASFSTCQISCVSRVRLRAARYFHSLIIKIQRTSLNETDAFFNRNIYNTRYHTGTRPWLRMHDSLGISVRSLYYLHCYNRDGTNRRVESFGSTHSKYIRTYNDIYITSISSKIRRFREKQILKILREIFSSVRKI